MNKIFCFFSFFVSCLLQADHTQETFFKAGASYEQGKIKEALSLYKKIDPLYPSVFYNSGLCYYSLGQYPEALVAFRKAQRLGNRALGVKAQQAIELTQKKLGISSDSALSLIFWLHNLIPSGLVRFVFLFLLIFLSIMVWGEYGSSKKRIGLFFLLLGVAAICVYDYWFSQQRYGIILSKASFVFAGPDKQFHKVSEISAGHQVKVVEHEQSWYKVYFPAGQGWVHEADLGVF